MFRPAHSHIGDKIVCSADEPGVILIKTREWRSRKSNLLEFGAMGQKSITFSNMNRYTACTPVIQHYISYDNTKAIDVRDGNIVDLYDMQADVCILIDGYQWHFWVKGNAALYCDDPSDLDIEVTNADHVSIFTDRITRTCHHSMFHFLDTNTSTLYVSPNNIEWIKYDTKRPARRREPMLTFEYDFQNRLFMRDISTDSSGNFWSLVVVTNLVNYPFRNGMFDDNCIVQRFLCLHDRDGRFIHKWSVTEMMSHAIHHPTRNELYFSHTPLQRPFDQQITMYHVAPIIWSANEFSLLSESMKTQVKTIEHVIRHVNEFFLPHEIRMIIYNFLWSFEIFSETVLEVETQKLFDDEH